MILSVKRFTPFSSDAYETQNTKWIDICKILFLLVITLLNVIRQIISNAKNKFKKFSTETVFLFVVYGITFTLAIMETFSITRFTPTDELLAKQEELIDFSDIFNNYRKFVTL